MEHVTLKWAINSAAVTDSKYATSALAQNSVYDCGQSTAATNAIGFAGYVLNYSKFYVLASRISIRASHGSNTTGIGSTACETEVCVYPSPAATAAASMSSALAQPGAKMLAFDVGGMKTITNHTSAPRLRGVTRQQYISDPANWGTAAAAPTNITHWNVATQSSAAQSNLEVHMTITIEYDVVFFQRIPLAISFEKKLLKLICERNAEDALRAQQIERAQIAGRGSIKGLIEYKDEGKGVDLSPDDWDRPEYPTEPSLAPRGAAAPGGTKPQIQLSGPATMRR